MLLLSLLKYLLVHLLPPPMLMAMSDTSSNPWAHLYHRSGVSAPHSSSPMFGGVAPMAESIVVTTTATTPVSTNCTSTPNSSGLGGSSAGHLAVEGRIGKSARKRSRASRRAPTTLLNTDTTNFRAMVQQFTGAPPSTTFSPGFSTIGGGGQVAEDIAFSVQHVRSSPVAPVLRDYRQQHQQLQRGPGTVVYPIAHSSSHDPYLHVFNNGHHRTNLDVSSDNYMATIDNFRQGSGENNNSHGYFL